VDLGSGTESRVRVLIVINKEAAAWRGAPALRDAVLRLEARAPVCVAERPAAMMAGGMHALQQQPRHGASLEMLLRTPDALVLGPTPIVRAVRILRSSAELDALAELSGIHPSIVAASLAEHANAYAGGITLIVVDCTPRATAGLACLCGAASAAGVPLKGCAVSSDAHAQAPIIAALLAPLAGSRPAGSNACFEETTPAHLVPMPERPSPGELLLSGIPYINALSSHCLLSAGASVASLLRTDDTIATAQDLQHAAALGGCHLAMPAAEVIHQWRTASLPAPPPPALQQHHEVEDPEGVYALLFGDHNQAPVMHAPPLGAHRGVQPTFGRTRQQANSNQVHQAAAFGSRAQGVCSPASSEDDTARFIADMDASWTTGGTSLGDHTRPFGGARSAPAIGLGMPSAHRAASLDAHRFNSGRVGFTAQRPPPAISAPTPKRPRLLSSPDSSASAFAGTMPRMGNAGDGQHPFYAGAAQHQRHQAASTVSMPMFGAPRPPAAGLTSTGRYQQHFGAAFDTHDAAGMYSQANAVAGSGSAGAPLHPEPTPPPSMDAKQKLAEIVSKLQKGRRGTQRR